MRAVPLSRYIVFFAIAGAGCATDLATKSWIFGRLGMSSRQPEWVWENILGFRTDLNEGALFGMGPGWTPLFATLSVVAAIGVLLWLFWAGAARDWLLTTALGCVTGGILGNLHDRLGLHGLVWMDTTTHHQTGEAARAVRDWILVMIGRHQWPAFNVADSLLCCGAGLLIWHAFTTRPKGEASVPQTAGG